MSEVPGGPVVRSHTDLVYRQVDGLELRVDLHLPVDRETVPLVVYLHGGGWRRGTRADFRDERQIPLAAAGFAVASVQYRLSEQAAFPAQLDDIDAAVAWLRLRAGDFGFDPTRLGYVGFSAGGHLAALAALSGRARAAAVVLFAPVIEPARWDDETLARPAPEPGTFAARAPQWPPPRRGALLLGVDAIDPGSAAYRAANPLAVLESAGPLPAFLAVHGTADSSVTVSHSESIHRAVLAAGGTSSLLLIAGADHESPAYATPEIIGATAGFLHARLASGESPWPRAESHIERVNQ